MLSTMVIGMKLQVDIDDPKRFRIEMTFSRGADLSPLEVMHFELW